MSNSATAGSVPGPAQNHARPNKHQQRTEATRLALLESARRVFASQGFEASRIEDIAAETGHTRGAFYAHFSSKEDLFFALLEQETSRRVHRIRTAMESHEDPELRLQRDEVGFDVVNQKYTQLGVGHGRSLSERYSSRCCGAKHW